jgi:quinoprotein dehydrogenase-associated probable ABC transporter substrate-binding protein
MKMPAWAASRLLAAALALGLLAPVQDAGAQTSDLVSDSTLRVCADPANFPMSTREETGYKNRLAELVASKLDRPLTYTWYPMATGFIRNTLQAKLCDVVMAYAQGHELVLNTNHYFTSVYTLIVPADGDLADVASLGDPALKGRRVGVIAGTPPAVHMARYGLMPKAKGYNLVVDRRHESPAVDMLNDLSAGAIDAAVLWGPLGGPLVKADYPDLKVIPLISEQSAPRLFYRITMGVRPGEKVWQRELNSLIRRNQDEINRLLVDAGVPLVSDLGTEMMEISN